MVGFGARGCGLDAADCVVAAGVDGGSDRGDGLCVVFGGARTLDFGLEGVE